MTKKPKNQPKPFIDALYEAEEGLEIQVNLKKSMYRKGNIVILKTVYSPVNKYKYAGELILEQPMLEREPQKPRIVTPGSGIIVPKGPR